MLPSLKNAMPLASIHCIYTLSHEWNPVEMLSWSVSCFSAFSASIFTWSNFSVSSLLADCSSRWSTRILFSFTCMAWQNWNMTLELSEKWGNSKTNGGVDQVYHGKSTHAGLQPKMETQQAAVKLQRGFWASNVEVWSKHGTITSKFDASDKPPMQVHSWPVLEKKYTWNKISGCREGGWKNVPAAAHHDWGLK